jgi:(4S)-4-hydroxy-5-phosphonooxypentane-2,3-dione isomerase
MAALSSDVAGTIKDANCHALDVTVSQKDPHQVFIFEAYTNAAAWNAHQSAPYFLKFYGTTAQMMTKLDLRPFSSVAMNGSATTQAGLFINAEDLDIVPAQFDAFLTAAKANAAATIKDPGAHEFDIAVLQKDPHHLLFFEAFDNAGALTAYQATDHFKAYQTATNGMISKSVVNQYTSVSMFSKGT